MPPQQIEASITNPFERFFTLASGVDHIESRSLPGVSLVKIYFQPGINADSDVSTIANLAMAQLRRLPQGTLPPVVSEIRRVELAGLPGDAERAKDWTKRSYMILGNINVRNQIANVPGASVPQPFGGKYRQIMVYVDPLKLQAHQLSPMDVVRQINESNLILPSGRREDRARSTTTCTRTRRRPMQTQSNDAAENGRAIFGDGGGRWQSGRRAGDSDQYCTRGRPAVCLLADSETGRRYEHDRGGKWNSRRAETIW